MNPVSTSPKPERQTWFRWGLKWTRRGILAFILLVVLLYIEEDLRGAYAWSKAKVDLDAQGISLDPQAYIPPPVPDAENFGALPIFQLEPDPKQKGMLRASALRKAFEPLYNNAPITKEEAAKAGQLPYLGNWNKGEKPDMDEVQKRLHELCQAASPPITVPPNASASTMLSLLYPALGELRAENVTHPQCRFDHDYLNVMSEPLKLDLSTSKLLLAKALLYEEHLAICDNEPQLVLDDLDVEWKIISGLQKEPLIISGLIANGVVSMQLAVIQEGLAQHIWNDEQLIKLDADLGRIDFLSNLSHSLRGNFVIEELSYFEQIKAHPFLFRRDWLRLSKLITGDQKLDWRFYLPFYLSYLEPQGDFDQGMAYFANSVILTEARMVDLASRRVYPDKGAEPPESASQAHGAYSAIQHFAYAQVQIDEARIACRLERYRLAHGAYPDTLDLLVPAYGAELPHDIMNGEPYHYKLNADGTYMLYSVGWNQKDDGGQMGPQSHSRYMDNLDWIWTNYPDLPKK